MFCDGRKSEHLGGGKCLKNDKEMSNLHGLLSTHAAPVYDDELCTVRSNKARKEGVLLCFSH